MKYLLLFFLLLLMRGCSPKLRQSFAKVSKPEKTWAIFHPFKTKKAFLISKEAILITDSIAKEDVIGNDINGGQLDAFKHSFWMARSTQLIGKNAALSLGKAHEKGNYKSYKKQQLEDGLYPDKPSSDMDLFNNSVGIRIGQLHKKTSKKFIIEQLLNQIQQGKMRILKKDSLGNFLDCSSNILPLDSLKGKWNTKKCLVKSNW